MRCWCFCYLNARSFTPLFTSTGGYLAPWRPFPSSICCVSLISFHRIALTELLTAEPPSLSLSLALRAVPLAPLFQPAATPATTPPSPSGESSAAHPRSCALDSEETAGDRTWEHQQQQPQGPRRRRISAPTAVASEFQRSLEALEAGADASSTLQLLDSLLRAGDLERVPHMFSTGTGRETTPGKTQTGRAAEDGAHSRSSSSSSSVGSEAAGATTEWTRSVGVVGAVFRCVYVHIFASPFCVELTVACHGTSGVFCTLRGRSPWFASGCGSLASCAA